MNELQTFHRKLELHTHKQWTQEELADFLEISFSYCSKVYIGVLPVSKQLRKKMHFLLDTDKK